MLNYERDSLRNQYYSAWENYQKKAILDPMETKIIEVIEQHPEYKKIFRKKDKYLDKDFNTSLGEVNPFMHLSLHLALREQLSTERPQGINQIHQALSLKLADPHEAEHKMMDIIANIMWQAQQNNTLPNEAEYLSQLKQCLYP